MAGSARVSRSVAAALRGGWRRGAGAGAARGAGPTQDNPAGEADVEEPAKASAAGRSTVVTISAPIVEATVTVCRIVPRSTVRR